MRLSIQEIRVLTPDTGKYLCNHNAKSISDKVYLGKNADPSNWVEIDETEKKRLEEEWESEIEEV